MNKKELIKYVGQKVIIRFRDDRVASGKLDYIFEWSSKYDYRTPGRFLINDTSFGIIEVSRVERMSIDAPCKDCEDRKMNCHSNCDRYLDYLSFNEKKKAIERSEKVDTSSGWSYSHKRK